VLWAIIALLTLSTKPSRADEAGEPGKGDNEKSEEIVVHATRSGRSAEKEPIKVEVLDREEIEEKLMMTPGNIAMMVSETPGIRTQITSPTLGAANIRIQGLKGRYTQLLSDGLPLYGGQMPGIGLLQIPPLDLGQVEIIKGAASALYGPSALGGVINLVAKRPGSKPEADMIVNGTSRNGQDAAIYAATPLKWNWSGSIIAGYDRQARQDLNHDGWADMPGYDRWNVRPRLFWSGSGGASLLMTLGAMTEQRKGGTMPGHDAPDGQAFAETLDSRRIDGGMVAEIPLGLGAIHLRASGMTQDSDYRFGQTVEHDQRQSYFTEGTFTARTGHTSWLAGAAFQADLFRSHEFQNFNYSYTVPALFGQVEQDITRNLTLAGSLRWDDHNRYGSRVSPRLSLLYRPGHWTFRGTVARGFYAPTPFVEEIEEVGLSRLEPLARLKAETANTASVEAGYKAGGFEGDITLFGSNIRNAVRLDDDGADRARLVNVAGQTRTRGAELLLRYRWEGFSVTGNYVYVNATEPSPSGIGRRMVPLTPRHTSGLTAMWEKEDRGKIGLEAYYTGTQLLEDNPYRTRGHPYVLIGAMGELILGRVTLFVNAENLLNVRQTHYDPLLLSRREPDGAWTVEAWAPLDGRVINGGIRYHFGGQE
jgi:iron complex outermembrane receptor protein